MAGEFFGNVAAAIGAPLAVAQAGAPALTGAAAPGVFTAPARPRSQDDFLRGIAVGAGLVLLGVLVGSLRGRRR
jgi:hypothetical protein